MRHRTRLGRSPSRARGLRPPRRRRGRRRFNERTPDWLSFFMFTSFTDRDGKMQLEALAQSGFDPLSRTCRFMLTEEGHHMFVGKSGVERILRATCAAMNAHGIKDPHDIAAVRRHGVIDLPTIQKKINFHYSVTLDLFGSEISTNAANAFNAGIKGRFHEDQIDDDHQLQNSTYRVLQPVDGRFDWIDAPALERHQRAPSRRLHRRLRAGAEGVEPRHLGRRYRLRTAASAPRVPPQSRRLLEPVGDAGRRHRRRGAVAEFGDRVAAVGIGSRIRVVVDAAVPLGGHVRVVDCAAHQRRRRQARRLRVRPPRVLVLRERRALSRTTTRPTRCCCRISRADAPRASPSSTMPARTRMSDIDQRANQFANLLRARGLVDRQRVLLCLEDGVDFPVCFLGAMRAGAIPVPLNTLLTAKDYAYIVADSEAKLLVVSADTRRRRGKALLEPASPLDVLVSGRSTSHPTLDDALADASDAYAVAADPARRAGVLAVHVGHHGQSERRDPSPRRSRIHRARPTAGKFSASPLTTSCSPRQNCSSPTGSATR